MSHWITFYQMHNDGKLIHTKNQGTYVSFRVNNNITSTNWENSSNTELHKYFDKILFYPLDQYNTDCKCCGARWNIFLEMFDVTDDLVEFIESKYDYNKSDLILHYMEFDNNIVDKYYYLDFTDKIITDEELEEIYLKKLKKDSEYFGMDNYNEYLQIVNLRRENNISKSK